MSMQQPKQDIVIEYKNTPAKIGMYFMLLISPAWVLVCGVGAVLALIGFLFSASAAPLSIALSLLCMFLICLSITMVLTDNKVVVSKTGLQFPLLMLPRLSGRRTRRWSDLKSAQLLGFKDGGKKLVGTLELRFYSGGQVTLKLQRMQKTEPEKILLAIDIWAPQCLRNEEMISTHKLLTSTNDNGGPSYTQLWEEELRRRFFPTSFVPLEAGAKLKDGKLIIVRQLAFGGLSALYLGQWDNRDLVVLKEAVVPQTVQEEARHKALVMFDREASLLARLNHPYISRVLDNFVENQRHYILLEHIPGQDLRQYVIENGAVAEGKVLKWSKEICDILSYLHHQDPPIIHRDLTPENLIINNRKEIVLIDFGAANEFLGSATGTVVGKQAYISPEQFRGKPCPQTDIYALGATIYFLLTGLDPEPLSTVELPPLVKYSDGMRAIVTKCTELELSERYSDVDELKSDIEHALEHCERN